MKRYIKNLIRDAAFIPFVILLAVTVSMVAGFILAHI